MGMTGILCALSAKRRAILEEDPELLAEVIGARHQERIPGLLELDKAWDALDVILGEDEDPLLGDAVLARTGRPFGADLGYGPPRLLEPDRVGAIADALERLPAELVEDRYPLLAGREIHGRYGPKPRTPGPAEYAAELDALDLEQDDEAAEREELTARLERVTAFYREAATRGDAVVAIVI
jgi:hypothetical protein